MLKPDQAKPTGPNPAAGLGMQLAVGMLVFTGGGYWLDQRRGGGVAFTLVGAGLGLFYVGYEIWKVVRSLNGGNRTDTDNKTNDRRN
ncbi:MAG TPA: AtpZ/AtpI family protein [Kiritimatiellia bacterium]|nr:AtpZ/AtpI family protein [Kiritimatiellia bacterium]